MRDDAAIRLMMMLDSFDGLVAAAKAQPEGQRFLMVFVQKELPHGAGPTQVNRFHAGQGGALVPVLYVDKAREEVGDFESLVAEATRTGQHLGKDSDLERDWDMVVVACLGGFGGRNPTAQEAEQPMQDLLRTIRGGGSLMHLVAFDRSGNPVSFQ